MDDTWRVKNSSTWTLPMPEILPSSLSRAIAPPMSTSSSCSANQMNTIHRHCIFPLASQAYNVENHATPQERKEPPIFPTLYLGVTDSGKSVMNNSFIATTPHNLLDGISPLHKLHGHNTNTTVSNSYHAPQITGIYPLNESTNGSILNPRVHLLDESRPSLLSKNFKSPNFLNALHFCPSNDRVINNNYYHHFHRQMNKIRFSPNLSAKTATIVPESILSRRRPRVICMTTVGELFLSELGLLGVTCYCHNMAMSVAKFCEHAGSSTNVAHAVHLESGMTVAQWRKLCFGNTAPDDGKGWDWPANSSTENLSVKSSVPLPLHPHTVGYVKTFSGLVNSPEEVSHTGNLVNAGCGSKGSYSIQSLFCPHPNSKSSITGCKSPSEEHKVSVNGHSSNSGLQLGQPPQIHTSVSSFPTATNPVQCKAQAKHPPKEKVLTANCHLDTKDHTSDFSYASYRSFIGDPGEPQHAIMPINNMIDGNANKDLPFSSLFQDYKHRENSASHNISFIDKLSIADSGSSSLGGIFPCILDKGKRPRYFENAIHNQQNSDTKSSQHSLTAQFVCSNNSEPERSQMYINFTRKDNVPVNNCTYNPVNLISLDSGNSTVSTSPNSTDRSEIAFKSTHDQGISHGQKLFDSTMERLALKSQRTCFDSGMNLQNDVCVADVEAVKSSRQGSLHHIKKRNRSAQTGSKYLCENELCKHAILTEGSSICFKTLDSSTCHACCANDRPCFRREKQIFDQKERCHKKPFFGNCCSVLAKHMASCCLYKDFNSTSSSLNNQSLCGRAKISQFRQTSNEIHKFHNAKCKSKKQYFTSGQPGLWRDVPAKITDASLLKSSIEKVAKTVHCSESKTEEQMSDTFTDFPAPALTEVSVEVHRETFCSNYSDNRKVYDFVVGKESVVEKCGSSDEAAFSECDKINAVGANQDNNMKSKNQEHIETGSPPLNSESSHRADHLNLKLVLCDEHTSPIQAHNVKQLSGLKRKEISGSLTEGFETNDKIKLVSSEKNKQVHAKESNHLDFRKPYKYISLNYIAKDGTSVKGIDKKVANMKVKPVVCGKYGGLSGQKKPTKIVSLSSLLKRTKKCNTNEYELLYSKSISSKARKMFLLENNKNIPASSHDLKDDTVTHNGITCGINTEENITRRECKKYQTKSRYKEVRSCSLSKLLATDHRATITKVSIDVKDSAKRYPNNEVHGGEEIHRVAERPDKMNFDASCCVCGRANKEEFNIMLECHRCLIKGPQQSEIVRNPKSRCARTESFDGLKSVEACNHKLSWNAYDEEKRCIVSQEQINAWAHINSLTSCRKTTVKPLPSDTDYKMMDSCSNHRYSKKLDANAIHLNQMQKEYVLYKQSKAWKNLVVYKSGIHSFGLYSSQFINRGTMVVEYVGEIIGQKVADKREREYEAGNRLQYKSACYFFKIDKDNIIDATRKGGIARFVNHSCQPNCVAKIITVRSEKKVVFFATRDINPGEEITYDYHFNSEDEGEKIPCYCNSKNCRQYMN